MISTLNKINTAFEIFRANKGFASKFNFAKCILYNLTPSKYRPQSLNFFPISSTIYVNTICNYRCSFCFLINDDHKGSKKFNLTLDRFNELIEHDFLRYSGRITLGGGEPFLNKYIFDFIKILKSNNKVISIYTNGSLLDRLYDSYMDNQVNYLNISHYDDKFASLRHIFKRINFDKKRTSITRLSKIVTNENFYELEEVFDEATASGFDRIILQNYFPYKKDEKDLVIYKDNKDFINTLNSLKKKHKKIKVIEPNLLSRRNKKFSCNNLSLNSTIDSEGNLSPCCFLTPPSPLNGNIFDENSNPWNSFQFLKFREKLGENSSPKSCEFCYFKHGIENRVF